MVKRINGRVLLGATWVASTLLIATPRAQTAQDILQATGAHTGLCIYAGPSNAAVLTDLHSQGQMLVHAVSLSAADVDKFRADIAAKDLQGFVTVEQPLDLKRLPYSEHLATLVVVDLDKLGANAPSQEEILRVTSPRGVAYVKKGGSWSKTVKPMPIGMSGEWQYQGCDLEGTNTSKDRTQKPGTSLQWIADYGWQQGNHGPHNEGMRLSSGNAYYHSLYRHYPKKGSKDGRTWRRSMVSRNAWSGVLQFKEEDEDLDEYVPFIPSGDTLYGTPKGSKMGTVGGKPYETPGGYLIGYDAKTGDTLITFTKVGRMQPAPGGIIMDARVVGSMLYVHNYETLYAVDRFTGDVKWTFSEGAKKSIGHLTISTRENKIYFIVGGERPVPNGGPDGGTIIHWRYTAGRANAIVSLDLTTGKQAWRSTWFDADLPDAGLIGPLPEKGNKKYPNWPSAGKDVNQIIYREGRLYVSSLMSGDEVGWFGVFDASTGNRVTSTTTGAVFHSVTSTVARDDGLFLTHYAEIKKVSYDPFKRLSGSLKNSDFNGIEWNNCQRTLGTPDLLVTSSTGYIDRQGRWLKQYIGRGGCGQQAYPANGMLYYPGSACTCASYLRGMFAVSSETVLPPLDDKLRLVKGETAQPTSDEKVYAGPDTTGTYSFAKWVGDSKEMVTAQGHALPPINTGKPLYDDWISQDAMYMKEITTRDGQGVDYVVDVHKHTVQARKGGSALWSFQAGGRISQGVTVTRGLVVFGSHDGWAYCLSANTGKLVWKYLGAGYEHKMVAYSQVESAWPVVGVAVRSGTVFLSAGRHPELNGGMHLYALRLTDGALSWHSTLSSRAKWYDNNTKSPISGWSGTAASVRASIPLVEGDIVRLRTAEFNLSDGKMRPHANPTYINSAAVGQVPVSLEGRQIRQDPEALRPMSIDRYGFTLFAQGLARVGLYDLEGRRIAVLFDGQASSGYTPLSWSDVRVSMGAYTLRLESAGRTLTRRVVLR